MIYRFTLRDDLGVTQFGTEMVSNWDDIEIAIVSSVNYNGLKSEVTSKFSFVGDIRSRFLDLRSLYGLNAKSYITIEVGNDNLDPASFEIIAQDYIADFTSIRISELTLDVDFFFSDFYLALKKSEKDKIDFTNTKALNGEPISDYKSILREVNVKGRTLALNSKLDRQEEINTSFDFVVQSGTEWSSPFPFNLKYSSDGTNINASSFSFSRGNAYDPAYPLLGSNYFITDYDKTQTYNISYNGDFEILGNLVAPSNADITIKVSLSHVDNASGAYNLLYFNDLYTKVFKAGDVGSVFPLRINIAFDKVFNLSPSAFVGLQISIKNENPLLSPLTVNSLIIRPLNDNVLNITGDSDYEDTVVKAVSVYNMMDRYIELITGKKGTLKSEFFTNGAGKDMYLCNGTMIRNIPIEEKPFNTSFQDLFKDLHNIFCLTAYVESNRFVIEPFADVYTTKESANLGKLVSDTEIEVDDKMLITNIAVGYKDRQLESLNGLLMINKEVEYSLNINNAEGELKIVSNLIAESYIIEEVRRKQYQQHPNEDTKYDKENFVLSCIDINGLMTTKQPSNTSDQVLGALAPDQVINYDITPARNFRRWAKYFNSSLNSLKLPIFIQTKQDVEVSTKLSTESEFINEKGDIEASAMDAGLFSNEKALIGDCILTREQYDAIKKDNFSTVQFADNKGNRFWGYIRKCIFKPHGELGNFELILSNKKNG